MSEILQLLCLHCSIYSWDVYRFTSGNGHTYWDDVGHQRSKMDEVARRLNITDHTGWYLVQAKSFKQLGGAIILKQYNGSLLKALATIYPGYRC